MADLGDVASTPRLGLAWAPGGLSVPQDLLNTAPMPASGVPDLLEDVGVARSALATSLVHWAQQTGTPAPEIELAGSDLPPLRQLRDDLRRWLLDPTQVVERSATVAVDARAGAVGYRPVGSGADRLTALVVTELLIAHRLGRLHRLKTCANQACGAAFYDGSPGASRVWHDVKICGNAANLRASRARRRATSA